MLKRTLVCLPALLLFVVGTGSTQVLAQDEETDSLDRISYPERYYSFMQYDESDTARSGFIRKGGLTGTLDKLMDINLFMGVRMTQNNNDTGQGTDDIDDFSVPFAALVLSGQAVTDIYYQVQYDFGQDARDQELQIAAVSWRPYLKDNALLEDFAISAGQMSVFISPAGVDEAWEHDFIEFPLLVNYLLPPGARDIGVVSKMDFLNQGRLKVWVGLFNGTHREIALPMTGYNPVPAFDVWGGGQDNDAFAGMARVQLNILDEQDFFLMVSGGVERNKLNYVEVDSATGTVMTHENEVDRIYNVAGEFRFLERKTWIKSEFMHAYLKDTNANTQDGFYLAAGSRLDFLHESMDHLELLARYDVVELNDDWSTSDDLDDFTIGLNFFLDPDHKHDAKLQLNYVFRDDKGPRNYSNNTFMAQFVLGF